MTEPIRRARAATAAKVMVTGVSLSSVLAMTAAMGSAAQRNEPTNPTSTTRPAQGNSVTSVITLAPVITSVRPVPVAPTDSLAAVTAPPVVAPAPAAAPRPIQIEIPTPAAAPAPDATTRTSS